jgi:hypothetical protein
MDWWNGREEYSTCSYIPVKREKQRLVNQIGTKDAASWLGPLIADELVCGVLISPNPR